MNNYSNSNGYLLLFRGTDWHKELSPELIQQIMGDWSTWFDRLTQQGKLSAANPLENEGVVITGKSRTLSDGPFAESKEAVGGFFLLTVDTFEEALEIGKECPALPYGIIVEVRPVAPACPAERMRREAELQALA
ncbi:YciI family protein [Luteolibacter luteus]|uniref:YCII-related domain-containing protein n=1 Tax=Luteolibacter luteus TaxID=2728835 RepID=A0A858RI29_9BACT|nr:YciI family protein [Luteolibacter luteus]QJE95880.1 hypothetical protein HHL09_08830 [Luteolibacter luteus]